MHMLQPRESRVRWRWIGAWLQRMATASSLAVLEAGTDSLPYRIPQRTGTQETESLPEATGPYGHSGIRSPQMATESMARLAPSDRAGTTLWTETQPTLWRSEERRVGKEGRWRRRQTE